MIDQKLIKSAEFKKGVVRDEGLPIDEIPQIAFIGRSNVGKSSVINTLTNRKALARSSSHPGFTAEANFFLINDLFYLVDLPGYGFARGSKDKRNKITGIVDWFFTSEKTNIKKVVLIIDAKIGATPDDIHMYNFLLESKKEMVIILNKYDKLDQNEKFKNIEKIKSEFPEQTVIKYSAVDKIGVQELFDEITKELV
jgi:GTP-binding protein